RPLLGMVVAHALLERVLIRRDGLLVVGDVALPRRERRERVPEAMAGLGPRERLHSAHPIGASVAIGLDRLTERALVAVDLGERVQAGGEAAPGVVEKARIVFGRGLQRAAVGLRGFRVARRRRAELGALVRRVGEVEERAGALRAHLLAVE